MRTLSCLVLLLAAAATARASIPSAPAGLLDARSAQSMIGGDSWSRLVRIDNAGPGRKWPRNTYPIIVYALVFELSGILWFYTDIDGTQSLSLTLGTLERDKADPGQLFRAIDAGFGSWSWIDDPPGPWDPRFRNPPNACFLESVGALYRRLAVGSEARSPQLLSYYVDTSDGRRGHTVLLFGTSSGLSAVDAESSEQPVSLPAYLGADPRALSVYIRGGPVAAARTLPIVCGRGVPEAAR